MSSSQDNFKPQDLFGATPRVRAALGMASKYNKLVDAGDDINETDRDTKNSSKYNKLVEEKSVDNKDKDKKVAKSKPVTQVQKKSQNDKVEARDGGKDNGNVQRKMIGKNTHISASGAVIKPQPRRRRESSSSYADDDSMSECKGTEFHYRELDDEYGSRPTVVTSVARPKDHDVISIVSTSSQEYDPAPKTLPAPVSTSSNNDTDPDRATPVLADPIIGHEHGVRPLLDDDELENAYYSGGQHARSLEIDQRSDMVSPSTESETPVEGDTMSPGPNLQTTDIFGAAPFRRKASRKKRPGSGVYTGSRSASREDDRIDRIDSPVKPSVTTKPKLPVKPSLPAKPKPMSASMSSVKPAIPTKPSRLMSRSAYNADDMARQGGHHSKPRRSRHISGEDMSVGLIRKSDSDDEISADIFGNAPFMKRSSSSADALTSTVSPIGDPGQKWDQMGQRNGFSSSFSADSLNLRSEPVSDSFGAVPFTNMQMSNPVVSGGINRGFTEQKAAGVVRGVVGTTTPLTTPAATSSLQSAAPSVAMTTRQVASPPAYPQIQETSLSTTDSNDFARREPMKSYEPTMLIPTYRKFKDESDSDEGEFKVMESSKYIKAKPSRSPKPADRDIESSAFSNMSFNDDFEDEENELSNTAGQFSQSMYEGNIQSMKSSKSQTLNVPRGQQSAFVKDPSPVNHDSAKPNNSGSYDTFTWPRKRHKIPQKPQATAEPFTVKKRVDVFK